MWKRRVFPRQGRKGALCVFISITIEILLRGFGLMRLLGLGKYLDKTSNKTDHNLNFARHVLLHKYFQLFIFHSKNLTLFPTEGKEHYHRLSFPELSRGTLSLELIKKHLEQYLWQGGEGSRLYRRCWELWGSPAKTGGRLRGWDSGC